jgi:hypothetical protein
VLLGGSSGEAAPADLAGNTCCRNFSLNVLGCTPAGCPNPAVVGAAPSPGGSGAVFGEVTPSPNLLLFTTNGGGGVLEGPVASLSANSADFTGSSATVTWPAVDGAQGYEVYMSVAGGDFQLIAKTAPGNNPVRRLAASAWSFNAALNGAAGVNPGAAAGYDGVVRNVVESFIPDVGDNVTPLAMAVPIPPGRVDASDGLADLSDGFADVRIAIGTVNSNGIVGSLGSPVTVVDNTGPTTNISATEAAAPLSVPGLAAANMVVNAAGVLRPGMLSGRGQLLQDLFSPTARVADGNADTITIGFSEPVEVTSAQDLANYQLVAVDGSTPARLAAITIVSATVEEGVSAGGLFTPANDIDGDGLRTMGNDVDGNGNDGNAYGHSYVTLRIAPATAGAAVDIRDGDYVNILTTSVNDRSVGNGGAGNPNRAVDVTQPQNRLADITAPRLVSATFVNGVLVVTFSEPMFQVGNLTLSMSSFACGTVPSPVFQPGDSSVRYTVDATGQAICDATRLRENDFVTFDAPLDNSTAQNPIDNQFDFLVVNAAGTFVPGGTMPDPDGTMPRLVSVVPTGGVGGALGKLTLTFDEPIGSFALGGVSFLVGGDATANPVVPPLECGPFLLQQNPTFAFADLTVVLEVNTDNTMGGNPACNIGVVQGVATGLVNGNVLDLPEMNITDLSGNTLDMGADRALFNNGGFGTID